MVEVLDPGDVLADVVLGPAHSELVALGWRALRLRSERPRSFYFLTLYLQGVSGYTPTQAGLAFLPQTIAAFAMASAVPRLTRHIGRPLVAVIGVALMVIAMARLSRLPSDTNYLTGIALAMLLYGAVQGLVLSSLTTASMAGVTPEDAGVAGRLVNVAHPSAARWASAS
jgi:predicted MFS family arabinose efflux permease